VQPSYSESFDVYIERNGVWTIEFMGRGWGEARRVADTLMGDTTATGMRLVRSRTSLVSGSVTEDLLIERTRAPRPHEPTVGAVSDAPDCVNVVDLLRPRARYCIHRLFQEWLETHDVGVLECMMAPRLFDQLLDRGSLVEKAVHRVAALQVGHDGDVGARVNALLALIDDVRREARRLQTETRDTAGVLEAIGSAESLGPGDAALASLVTQNRTRYSKLMQIVLLLGDVENPAGITVLDRWLSDYVMDHTVTRELAGQHAHVVDGLEWIASTILGEPSEEDPIQTSLSQRIASGLLGQTRDAMIMSFDHALRQEEALMDGTPGGERSAVLRLIRLCSREFPEFLGGPRLAARLTYRFAALEKAGKSAAFAEAMETITVDLDTCADQLSYLTALLSGSELGSVRRRLMRAMDNSLRLYGGLDRYFSQQNDDDERARARRTLTELVRQVSPGPKTLEAWTAAIADASGLPG